MADTMLSFSDNSLATSFLSKDDIRRMCPMAFKTAPTNPGVSGRYTQANTATVIDDLAKLGWYPVQAKQAREKKGSSGIRSFHMIGFQNPDIKIHKTLENGEKVVDTYPRIILTNSHDGFNSFKFILGVVRLICSNGLVLCSDEFANLSIRHINYTFEILREVITDIVEKVPYVVNTMNGMKSTILSKEQKRELATAVIKIRKEIDDNKSFSLDETTITDILMPVREEDRGEDLWTVFNVCQEKMIKGGFHSVSKNNKIRKQRSITSVKKDIKYNQQLWNLAMSYLPYKVSA